MKFEIMVSVFVAIIAFNFWFAWNRGLIEFTGDYKTSPIMTSLIAFTFFFISTLVLWWLV